MKLDNIAPHTIPAFADKQASRLRNRLSISRLSARVFVSAIFMLMSVRSASAGDILFEAKLSDQDHFSSGGKRLTTVAAIIRQDRANNYKYDKRDADDTRSDHFRSAAARDSLERDIAKLKISKSLRDKILNGTPMIFVGMDDDDNLVLGLKDWVD